MIAHPSRETTKMTTFSRHMSPDDALGRIVEQADLIEALVAGQGPGGPERDGRIRVAAGRIKDHVRLLEGEDTRGLLLEDGEAARKAVIESPGES
jgi:hypothetical protein